MRWRTNQTAAKAATGRLDDPDPLLTGAVVIRTALGCR
jgi:hypothetical protein